VQREIRLFGADASVLALALEKKGTVMSDNKAVFQGAVLFNLPFLTHSRFGFVADKKADCKIKQEHAIKLLQLLQINGYSKNRIEVVKQKILTWGGEKMKAEVISVRPFGSNLAYLRRKAQTQQTKISAMVRSLLHRGVTLERKAIAIKDYKAGKVSLREAAKTAGGRL